MNEKQVAGERTKAFATRSAADPLHEEADELIAILVASVKTIKARRRR
ncbi:MAG TPA: hypothetical protein VGF28_24975 [Thermoanaerobaculia bacterium]|jgi:hypothetical protein